jgi:type II secretion system protein G
LSDTAKTRGFSFIELIITIAVIGILAAISVPALMEAIDRSRQSRTMADLRSVSTANATYFLDMGDYAGNLVALDAHGSLPNFPPLDPWGTPWHYHHHPGGNKDGYHMRSFGSDGKNGPAPPVPWINAPYEPEIELTNGVFTKAPTGQ